jgi:hypothetical protein
VAGIGTHDWILGRAISIAGTSAAWVDRTTAYRATDDPDTYNTSPFLHTFKEKGARGAPYAVSEHQGRCGVPKGDRKTASKNSAFFTLHGRLPAVPRHQQGDHTGRPFTVGTNDVVPTSTGRQRESW